MAQIEKAREQANLHHRYEDEGCGPDCLVDFYERGYNDAMAEPREITDAIERAAWRAYHEEYSREPERKYYDRNKTAMRAAIRAAYSMRPGVPE